jgi:hypothetical protein
VLGEGTFTEPQQKMLFLVYAVAVRSASGLTAKIPFGTIPGTMLELECSDGMVRTVQAPDGWVLRSTLCSALRETMSIQRCQLEEIRILIRIC